MQEIDLAYIKNKHFFLIGIKGSGMSGLAVLLKHWGAQVEGSDGAEEFYTEGVLKQENITYFSSFEAQHIHKKINFIIYSGAYSKCMEHPEIKQAKALAISIYSYTEFLAKLSAYAQGIHIAGVHGKTSSTILLTLLLKDTPLEFFSLCGTVVPALDYYSSYFQGEKFFVCESCEYEANFLRYFPQYLLLTNLEWDHPDYYPSYEALEKAFFNLMLQIQPNGVLVYCLDDKNLRKLVDKVRQHRLDIEFISYGLDSTADYAISHYQQTKERQEFILNNEHYYVHFPSQHNIVNLVGCMALAEKILTSQNIYSENYRQKIQEKYNQFHGVYRRQEWIGQKNGISFMDDYAHHPTEIKATLEGISKFYQPKRLIVDFMFHTFSRTKALWDDFLLAFDRADILILHKIYSSAREEEENFDYAYHFYLSMKKHKNSSYYFEEILDAYPFVCDILQKGDLFISLGAGNNWQLSHKLYFSKETK